MQSVAAADSDNVVQARHARVQPMSSVYLFWMTPPSSETVSRGVFLTVLLQFRSVYLSVGTVPRKERCPLWRQGWSTGRAAARPVSTWMER